MPPPPRIGILCYFDPDTYPGVYNGCNLLAQRGWSVDVLALDLYGFGGEPFDTRVRVHRFGSDTGGTGRFLSLMWNVRRLGRSRGWQVVIGNDMLGFMAARLSRVVPPERVVFWSQDLAEPVLHFRAKALLFAMKRRLLRNCPLAIAPSQTRAEAMKRFYQLPGEPIVVYNSPRRECRVVDERDWRVELGFGQDDLVGVYAGGLGELRLVPTLLESVACWREGVKLVIAGYGTDAEVEGVRRAAAEGPSAQRIRFVGHLPSALGLLKAGDFGISLFQTVSERRNFNLRGLASNKVFEALAVGKPVLVSRNDEIEAFVRQHDCGVCVQDPTPTGIAKAVRELTASRGRLAEMGANALRTHREETYFEKRFTPVIGRLEQAIETGSLAV